MSEPHTVKVRIPVVVRADGSYYSHGWRSKNGQFGPKTHELLMHGISELGPNDSFHWLTAELPIPEPREVQADVEVGDGN